MVEKMLSIILETMKVIPKFLVLSTSWLFSREMLHLDFMGSLFQNESLYNYVEGAWLLTI